MDQCLTYFSHLLILKLQAIVRQDPAASPKDTIHMISIDFADSFHIFISNWYCYRESC